MNEDEKAATEELLQSKFEEIHSDGTATDFYEEEASAPTFQAEPGDPANLPMDVVVQQVLDGQWGSGLERKMRLKNAGYDYIEVLTEAARARR